jgi:hypothetical protein
VLNLCQQSLTATGTVHTICCTLQVMHNLGVLASYTLETSFGGANGSHYTANDLRQMGVDLCAALLDFSACLNITRNAALPTPSPRTQPADCSSVSATDVCNAAVSGAFSVAAGAVHMLTVSEPAAVADAAIAVIPTESDCAATETLPPAATEALHDDTCVSAEQQCAVVADTAAVTDSSSEQQDRQHRQLYDELHADCISADDAVTVETDTDKARRSSDQLSQLAVTSELSVTFTAGELQHMLQEEIESVSTVATAAAEVVDRSRANSASSVVSSIAAVKHDAALTPDVTATTVGAINSAAGGQSTLEAQPAAAHDDDAGSGSSDAADVAEIDSSSGTESDADVTTEAAEVADDVCDASDLACLAADDDAEAQQRAASDCAVDEQLEQMQVGLVQPNSSYRTIACVPNRA